MLITICYVPQYGVRYVVSSESMAFMPIGATTEQRVGSTTLAIRYFVLDLGVLASRPPRPLACSCRAKSVFELLLRLQYAWFGDGQQHHNIVYQVAYHSLTSCSITKCRRRRLVRVSG